MITVGHQKDELWEIRILLLHQRLQRIHCRPPFLLDMLQLAGVKTRRAGHGVLGMRLRKTAKQIHRLGKVRLLPRIVAMIITKSLVEDRIRLLGILFVLFSEGVEIFGRSFK